MLIENYDCMDIKACLDLGDTSITTPRTPGFVSPEKFFPLLPGGHASFAARTGESTVRSR